MQCDTPEETLRAVAGVTVGGRCRLTAGPPHLRYPLAVTVLHVGHSVHRTETGERGHCATVRTDDGYCTAVRITSNLEAL